MPKRQQFEKSFAVTLADNKWHIIPTGDLPDAFGITNYDDKTILLEAIAEDEDFLDTTVHELLHAQFPWMREWQVAQTGTEIAATLWKMGYRKP